MKRRSITKKPHDPHELYLDEGLSGQRFASLLKQAGLCVHEFQKLLPKNKKVSDTRVIECAARANYVIISRDLKMETDWTECIIANKAKVIVLTDTEGGPIHWASALIAGRLAWTRALLDHPSEPLTIRIGPSGAIKKLTGEVALREQRDRLLIARISQAKKSGDDRLEVLKKRA